jgi:hypothetical protein
MIQIFVCLFEVIINNLTVTRQYKCTKNNDTNDIKSKKLRTILVRSVVSGNKALGRWYWTGRPADGLQRA